MRHPFRAYTFHIRYACEACWFGIVPFWTALECPRERAFRIWSKFQRHNADVLRYTILDVQSGNSEVMLLKFHPDPNQTSRHKHALSVTLGWV
jgi:hypothetical protein